MKQKTEKLKLFTAAVTLLFMDNNGQVKRMQ